MTPEVDSGSPYPLSSTQHQHSATSMLEDMMKKEGEIPFSGYLTSTVPYLCQLGLGFLGLWWVLVGDAQIAKYLEYRGKARLL